MLLCARRVWAVWYNRSVKDVRIHVSQVRQHLAFDSGRFDCLTVCVPDFYFSVGGSVEEVAVRGDRAQGQRSYAGESHLHEPGMMLRIASSLNSKINTSIELLLLGLRPHVEVLLDRFALFFCRVYSMNHTMPSDRYCTEETPERHMTAVVRCRFSFSA